MLLCGFKSPMGFESSGFSMWHFLKLVARGFLRVLRFPPLFHQFNGSANIIELNTCDLNSVKLNSLSCPFIPHETWHVAWYVASAKRSICCTWFAHDCAQATWVYWRQFAAQWRDCKKSEIVPLSLIIIIIIIIILQTTQKGNLARPAPKRLASCAAVWRTWSTPLTAWQRLKFPSNKQTVVTIPWLYRILSLFVLHFITELHNKTVVHYVYGQ